MSSQADPNLDPAILGRLKEVERLLNNWFDARKAWGTCLCSGLETYCPHRMAFLEAEGAMDLYVAARRRVQKGKNEA